MAPFQEASDAYDSPQLYSKHGAFVLAHPNSRISGSKLE